MDASSVIKLIVNAFKGVSRDGGISLHETEVIDRCGGEKARNKAREKDIEKNWVNVPDKAIEDHQEALCFLDPKGFKYYLPAYMVWALNNYRISNSLSSDHPIYRLDVGEEEGRKYFSDYTQEQKMAIIAFLKYMAADTEGYVDTWAASEALRKYWSKWR